MTTRSRRLPATTGTVVLHCFSSPHFRPAALERGWDVPSPATCVPEGFRSPPRGDASSRQPDPRRDGRAAPRAPACGADNANEPAYVAHTLAALAQARGEEPGELERQIDANATACFGLVKKQFGQHFLATRDILPCPGPDHQPWSTAPRGRQHLLLADQHGPHDRAVLGAQPLNEKLAAATPM